MTDPNLKICPQQHQLNNTNHQGEKRTLYVLAFTIVMMVIEIVAGSVYGSMALLADGWHMSTHAAAFMITLFTYRYARKHANSTKFSFGTGKVGALGGFSSAIALTLVALVMLVESLQRFWTPHEIHFNEAIFVACLGLAVNLVSAYLLKDDHHHHHGHDHSHAHHHEHHLYHKHEHEHEHEHEENHTHHHEEKAQQHQDHNLKAAYMHVLADALTSVLAIVALFAAKFWGWNWLDAMMGIVGAVIITKWSIGLIKQTNPILLDASLDEDYLTDIVTSIKNDDENNQIHDLHVWKISSDHYAAMLTIQSAQNKPAEYYRQLLTKFDKIEHLTIEVQS